MSQLDADLHGQAQEIVAHIRALRRELLCASAADIASSGLTGPQVSVMSELVINGPTTLTELGNQIGLSHSTTSGIVDRLQARGLVQRLPDATDRRYTRISVTEIVEDYVQDLDIGPFGRLAAVLAGATAEQRHTIRAGLALLRQLLDRRADAETRDPVDRVAT
jgi:DNA-binding MarR family transcriptional regulator